jgi:enoyl-CoA hydratase/carnithine racemase
VEEIFGAQNENDTVEGIFQRLCKQKTEWAEKTYATLQKMSPISLKVTHREMREGANKNAQECFVMEYRIASRMMENPDFFEGVRAVIIDKDRAPKWQKKEITQVTNEQVASFFEPLEEDKELVLYTSE